MICSLICFGYSLSVNQEVIPFTWKVLIPFLVVQSLTLEYCYYSWHVYHTQGQFGRDSTMEVNSRLDVKPSILMIMSNGTNL